MSTFWILREGRGRRSNAALIGLLVTEPTVASFSVRPRVLEMVELSYNTLTVMDRICLGYFIRSSGVGPLTRKIRWPTVDIYTRSVQLGSNIAPYVVYSCCISNPHISVQLIVRFQSWSSRTYVSLNIVSHSRLIFHKSKKLIEFSFGAVLGFLAQLYQERLYRRYVSKKGPEARLFSACVAAFLFPAGKSAT